MADEGPFAQDALEANRAGRLTDGQRRNLRRASRGTRKAELQFAGVFTILGLLVWFAEAPAKYATLKPLIGIAFLIVAGFLGVRAFMGADSITHDVRSGHVESAEGAIAKRSVTSHSKGSSSSSYYFDVAGQSITVSRVEYEAAPDAGYVKVYFVPHSHWLVNMERLPDRALPADALKSPVVAQELLQAMRSHDPIEMAEARAQTATMRSTMKAQLIQGAVPPPTEARDPRPLAQSILGAWSNPMMSVSFAADGTLSATLPGGNRRSGHWSVDASGQLMSDVTGGSMPAEAWVSGDQLTVTMGGRGLTFARVTS